MTKQNARAEAKVEWLTDREQRVWRAWVDTQALINTETARRMGARAGLSMSDYVVLVMLTESPDGELRMAALADAIRWERSRLSHQVSRMQERGLLVRRECPEDGRGLFVSITEDGRQAIEQAAPSHVADVRELFFDRLEDEDLACLERTLGRLTD